MMTEREMADKNLLKLLILLYDICKDALKDFFRPRCCNDTNTLTISKYIKDHKVRLYEHFIKGECHMCSDHESQHSCIKIKRNQLSSFFESTETLDNTIMNKNAPNLDLLKEKDFGVDSLDIFNVQYLLLADDLQLKEHQWILNLYTQRLRLSEMSTRDMSDEQYSKICDDTRKTVSEMYQISRDRWQVQMVVKQMEYLSMATPEWKNVRQYWNIMQEEFNMQELDFPTIVLPETIKGHQKDDSATSLKLNINAVNVFIGDNNTVTGLSENIQRQLDELIRQQEMNHILLERFNQTLVLANVKGLPAKTGDEKDESRGVTCVQSGKTGRTESKTYTVEWHIKNPQGLDQEDKMNIIRYMESVEIPTGEQIAIKFVHRGSVIIGTTITANIVEDVNLFFTAFKTFFKIIIERCNINTKSEIIIQVDVTIKESTEHKSNTDPHAEIQLLKDHSKSPEAFLICEKCLEKTEEISTLKRQLRYKDEVYGQLFLKPTDSIKSVGSLSTLDNRTIYAKPDENEILYAEFPKVLVKACNNYEHMVDNCDIVASMTQGNEYYLIKKVGDWSEIIESPTTPSESSTSFFVLSKYLQILHVSDDPDGEPLLTPYKQSSIVKRGLNLIKSSGSDRRDLSGSIVSIDRGDDTLPEDDYAVIVFADQQELTVRVKNRPPLRRTKSEGLPLQRRSAKRFSASESSETVAALERKEAILKTRTLSDTAPKTNY